MLRLKVEKNFSNFFLVSSSYSPTWFDEHSFRQRNFFSKLLFVAMSLSSFAALAGYLCGCFSFNVFCSFHIFPHLNERKKRTFSLVVCCHCSKINFRLFLLIHSNSSLQPMCALCLFLSALLMVKRARKKRKSSFVTFSHFKQRKSSLLFSPYHPD